jgi:hypothetical protein
MKKIFAATVFALIYSSIAFSKSWDLNDVSILMDLPRSGEGDQFLLKPRSSGMKGELLPDEHSETLRFIVVDVYDNPEHDYEALRVVGMRIDPCFIFTDEKVEKCDPVLRLIWQPLNFKKVTTYDAAVHTFYSLTKDEFKILATKLKALKMRNESLGIYTDSKPLFIHPALKQSGRRLSFNNEIKKIILNFAGNTNLNRITIMKMMTKDLWWQFSGLDKNPDGKWANMAIPRLNVGSFIQDFFNDDFFEKIGMKGTILPFTKFNDDDLSRIVRGPDISEYDREDLKKAMVTINRIENPRIHSPSTLDCVHCHITEATRIWADKVASPMVKEYATAENLYVKGIISKKHNLTNITRSRVQNKSIRAFGYFGNLPSINQRTINESSQVAEDMNKAGY